MVCHQKILARISRIVHWSWEILIKVRHLILQACGHDVCEIPSTVLFLLILLWSCQVTWNSWVNWPELVRYQGRISVVSLPDNWWYMYSFSSWPKIFLTGAWMLFLFTGRFELMRSSQNTYYVTVIEDTSTGSIIGAASLIIEQKFIHSCGCVSIIHWNHKLLSTKFSDPVLN